MEFKKWFKSPWVISIGTAIFSFLLTIIRDYVQEKPIFSTLGTLLFEAGNYIILFLNLNIKVWWLLSAIALILLIVYFLHRSKRLNPPLPDHYNYNEDKFTHWKWTWEYTYIKKVGWVLDNLKAYCPLCDTILQDKTPRLGDLLFKCPRCKFTTHSIYCDDPEEIREVILDNIRRKMYSQEAKT